MKTTEYIYHVDGWPRVLGKHFHPYANQGPRYDEPNITARLCISVSAKYVETGEDFGLCATRGGTVSWSGTSNDPYVKAAMCIVDWMRDKTIVPAPQNWVLLKKGERRLEEYFGTRIAAENKTDHADRERSAREKRRRDDGLQKRDIAWREEMRSEKRQVLAGTVGMGTRNDVLSCTTEGAMVFVGLATAQLCDAVTVL